MTIAWTAAPAPVVTATEIPPAPPLSRIKVLHVITRLDAGAGGNTLLSAAGMDRNRYDVWIAGAAGGPLWEEARRKGVHTIEIPSLRREVAPFLDVAALLQLMSLIRREKFAIVHAHSAKAGVLGRLAALLCRVPFVVYTLHGRDPWWPAGDDGSRPLRDVMSGQLGVFLLLERLLRRATARFIAVSPTVARDAVLAGVARAGDVDVVVSAVDLERIPSEQVGALRSELGIEPEAPLVGTVGRLDPQKAPLDFVRMAAAVHRRRPDACFVMIGEGELEAETAALAKELRVPICFAGYRPDAAVVASAFDVFVIASLYEGVGRAITEAMASGRPVVATAVDGLVDIVVPGATGLLAAPRDPDGLAERVCWMLDHPVEAAMMGVQARAYVRSMFSPTSMCASLDRIYSRALGLPAEGTR